MFLNKSKKEGVVMGMEVNKINGSLSSAELTRINQLQAEDKNEQKIDYNKNIKKEDLKEENNKIDSYSKHPVTDSIEKQIKEQKAKIEELQKNLDGLRDEYNTTRKAEHEARKERYAKEIEQHQKRVSENILKRLFFGWKLKFLKNKEDAAIKRFYKTSYFDYEMAGDETKNAEKAYDIADIAAYDAIHAHNIADAHYLSGLWIQQDAYWDLASLYRRKMIAMSLENRFNRK